MTTDRLRVTAENVGIEVHRSRQIRRRRKAEFSLTVLDVKVAREHRLSVLHDVEISGPSFLGGEDFHLNVVAGFVDGAFRAQKNLILAFAGLQLKRGRGMVSFFVLTVDL